MDRLYWLVECVLEQEKIVFPHLPLPFGSVGVSNTHWQIARTNVQTKICKRVQFLPPHKALLKVSAILILLFVSITIHAQDYYITTTNLNLRNGAGKNYKSITILVKGDTVKLLDSSGDYWAKIQYQDKIGFSAKQYLQKTEIIEEAKIKGENGFIAFLIFLLIVITTAVLLIRSGKKYRKKSIATILSFFFGIFGFQKFYLGEKNKGIYSILFCWTFIPTLVGLVDFINVAVMKEARFNRLYNWGKRPKAKTKKTAYSAKLERRSILKGNPQRTTYLNKSKQNYLNDTIIDVNSERLDLTVGKNIESIESNYKPPYWLHFYVYSYEEIKYATKAQKKYYSYFKGKVLNGEFVDIQGNTNYAFILYFDFLNEYQNHRDIKLLYKQFKLLSKICPKTRSYSLNSLQDELRKKNDSYSVDKLKDLEEPNYQFEHSYSDYNSDLYKLGNKYKYKLGLNRQEIRWLNKFYFHENTFTSIEGCLIYTIKQYCKVLKNLEKKLAIDNLTEYIEKEIKDNLIRKSDYFSSFESNIYLLIFKNIENSVRESCQHSRKLTTDTLMYYSLRVQSNFDKHLGVLVSEIIDSNKLHEPNLQIQTQIELNAYNTARWKSRFISLKEALKNGDKEYFINGVENLEIVNKKNPNIENIFFDASKIIAKYDNVQSLKYYAKYIYYDLKSKKFDNKELTKTVQKSLFKTDEQINDFKEIIEDLIATKDIQTALEKISKIYIPKRKRIQLDRLEIQEVEQKQEGTVELLNEYLVDNKENSLTEIDDKSDEGIEIAIIQPKENNSIFITKISMKQVQEELVKMIINNSFQLHQDEVEKYATQNGMFKNQLIDSVNEACEEYLDGEALIEEDDENYIIEESYYKEVTK